MPEAVRGFLEQPARLRDVFVPGWQARDPQAEDAERPALRAALGLALDFGTWRTLVRDQGLDEGQAMELMVQFVACVAEMPGPSTSG